MEKIEKKWFYFPTIGLLLIFAVKLIEFSQIVRFFPVNVSTDLALKISELYFLANYGFHAVVPHWYNGFVVFQIYPPGWYFFSLPIYWLVGDYMYTAFISLIMMLLLGFLASYLIFKNQGFSKKIIFFILFFMNPIIIDYIFFIGRFPELFAWAVYLFIFYLVFRYKDKKFDIYGIILLILFFSIILISHQYVAILALFLIFSLFLIKPLREKTLMIVALISSLALSSFFWIDFLRTLFDNPYAIDPTGYQRGVLLDPSSLISFNTFVMTSWFVIFYFYNKEFIKNKKERLFFYSFLIFSVLVASRAITLIPFFREVPANSYNLFFMSLSLWMLFKVRFPRDLAKVVKLSLLLIPILTSFLVFSYRPESPIPYDFVQEDIIYLFSEIHERYIIIKNNELSDDNPLISVATVGYNLSTPFGLYLSQMPKDLYDLFESMDNALKSRSCAEIAEKIEELDVKNVITYRDSCGLLKECGFNLSIEKKNACLFFA